MTHSICRGYHKVSVANNVDFGFKTLHFNSEGHVEIIKEVLGFMVSPRNFVLDRNVLRFNYRVLFDNVKVVINYFDALDLGKLSVYIHLNIRAHQLEHFV